MREVIATTGGAGGAAAVTLAAAAEPDWPREASHAAVPAALTSATPSPTQRPVRDRAGASGKLGVSATGARVLFERDAGPCGNATVEACGRAGGGVNALSTKGVSACESSAADW